MDEVDLSELPACARWMTPTGHVDDVNGRVRTADVIVVSEAPTNYVDVDGGLWRCQIAGNTGQTVRLTVWGKLPAGVTLARGERLSLRSAKAGGYGGEFQLSADATSVAPAPRTCATPTDLRPLSPAPSRELTADAVEAFYKIHAPAKLRNKRFLAAVMRYPDDVIVSKCMAAYGAAPTATKPAAGGGFF